MNNNRVNNIGPHGREKSSAPVVISVLSGKGGVGKSIIAYNLSALAANEGQTVLTVDTDWYFGNLHILANINPRATLADTVVHRRPAWQAMIPLGEKWQLMASPAALESIEELDNGKLRAFIQSLKQIFNRYNLIVVDTPSASIDIISTVAEIAEVNLIVVNPELTSLADGFGLYKYLLQCRRDSEAYLFLNRAGSKAEALYIYQKFTLLAQKFLNKVPLSGGYLLDDRHIIDAIARQKPLYELSPESPAVRSLHRLLKRSTDLPAAGRQNRTINREERINLKKALADIKE